jgi:hypothetical protein
MTCPRSHDLLRLRDVDRPLDDISGEMRAAYDSAVLAGCGHEKTARYARIKEKEQEVADE